MAEIDALLTRHKARQERDDWRAALVTSMIANVHRGKDQEPYKITDFMPSTSSAEEAEPQSLEMQLALVEMWNVALGGEDLRQAKIVVSD